MPLTPVLRRPKQTNLCEFEASPVHYRVGDTDFEKCYHGVGDLAQW